MSRADVINQLLALFDNPSYLEIGVNRGETFRDVVALEKTAVDPKFLFDPQDQSFAAENCLYFEVSSDEFFGNIVHRKTKYDLIYLDGLHTVEQTLRDFNNSLFHLKSSGVILIDDVRPNSYDASVPDIDDAFKLKQALSNSDHSWMGDTYKLLYFIETFFPKISYCTIQDNHGQAVVWVEQREPRNIKDRTLESIGRVSFAELIIDQSVLRLHDLKSIVEHLRRRT